MNKPALQTRLETETPTFYEGYNILWGKGLYEGMCLCYDVRGGNYPLLKVMFPNFQEAVKAIEWKRSVDWLATPPLPADLVAYPYPYTKHPSEAAAPVEIRHRVGIFIFDPEENKVMLIDPQDANLSFQRGILFDDVLDGESHEDAAKRALLEFFNLTPDTLTYNYIRIGDDNEKHRDVIRLYKATLTSKQKVQVPLEYRQSKWHIFYRPLWVDLFSLKPTLKNEFQPFYLAERAFGHTIPTIL